MQLSLMTDSLGTLNFPEMLTTAQQLGIQGLELATGNWSQAPHIDLDRMVENAEERKAYMAQIADAGLQIVALNCSGNPLAPNELGRRHHEVTLKTFRLAGLLNIDKIIMMSGLPGGSPSDITPNWITTSWPPENMDTLTWQWEEKLIPYWQDLTAIAQQEGVKRVALENHGCQCVYNAATLKKLRAEIGPLVGMNLDPSHLFWMGADPRFTVRDLGKMIYHVHAKDVRLEQGLWQPHGMLDTQGIEHYASRTWNYVAVGHGHDVHWWKEFFSLLAFEGYDGPVSLEMEDMSMDQITGVYKSIAVMKESMPHRY